MECPRCGSTNVTSMGFRSGKWHCMETRCNHQFDRDHKAKRNGLIPRG